MLWFLCALSATVATGIGLLVWVSVKADDGRDGE